MARRVTSNLITFIAIIAAVLGTGWAVRRFHKPGQLDVVTAQAMDMSAMRPPVGAAPVALTSVRQGALDDTVTYTGTIRAYNEQDISPRIVGTVLSILVYPGDHVRAGQLVAQLDTAEESAKADQADAVAEQAQLTARSALITHHLHHRAALAQAAAQEAAAEAGVRDAQSEAQGSRDAVADAQGGVQSAQASADYWRVEVVREKQLADAGAVSLQEYQSELSQAQAANAALAQARSKVRQAQAGTAASDAKVVQAQREETAAQAGTRMAQADLVVAANEIDQDAAGAVAAQAAAREARVVQGYTRIISPADGVVTERAIAPGTLVQPGMVILKVAEISRVRVQAQVAVADMAGIGPGASVTILSQDAGAKPLHAAVTSVFPAANDQTRTAVVEAVIPNPGGRLLPGAFVTMRIAKSGVTDKTLVPAVSVISDGGNSYVWLASGGALASAIYRCEKCHMTFSASDAKRDGYHDPMDGGRLLPVTTPALKQNSNGLSAHRVAVVAGVSDGVWTEIVAGNIPVGSRVVTRGQAGLLEGVSLVATTWNADGPKTLPTVASSPTNQLYRCEKCGMTYSAADAKRNNYHDPMDGGLLVPVGPSAASASPQMPGMKM